MTVSLSRDVTTTISCVPKMAESVREVERNRNKNLRLMSENGDCLSEKSDKKIPDTSVNNLKSLFYLNNVQNNCFSKYSVNSDGVNRASEFCPDVDGFSNEYKRICTNNEENCRKKRCSDRYDSSESSDSGIAVSSSASSGTSDITDPGSPFSTSSEDSSGSPGKCKVGKRCKSEEKSPTWSEPSGRCRSEEKTWTGAWERKQQSDKTDHNFITPETDFKMAPNAPSASNPCDIWTSITENNTANDTAPYNHFNNKTQSEAISNKRLKLDAKESSAPLNINNNVVVNAPSPIISEIETDVEESKKSSSSDNCEGAKVKTRRSSHDSAKMSSSDTTADVASSKANKSGTKACDKSVGCAAKSKTNGSNRHQGKITEYFKSQIKSLAGSKRDFGQKKDGVAASKGKPSSKSESSEPLAKKQKMAVEEKPKSDAPPVFLKPSPKPLEVGTSSSDSIRLPPLPDFLSKKPAETKTLFNKILQNHKNRKLAESYVKSRSSLKPKVTSDVVSLPSSSSALSAPSTSSASSSSASSSSSLPSHKPYETSTSNNLTETGVGKIEGLSSNLEDKVQNKGLESKSLVVSNLSEIKICDVISSRTDAAVNSALSKTPILSAPTTIRFPATGQNNRVDKKHRTTRENNSCRWDSCSMESSSASGLLEHLQTAHVLTQVSGEKFVCLWVGCKVFDQKSCSRSWLERHVLSHAGNKPYRCIVDGCGQGFSTQSILERHVNNHFAVDVKKALDNSVVHKLLRKNGKKLRYRRQPWSARMFDYFDPGIMEGLEHRLVKMTKARTGGNIAGISGKCLALTSQVLARRRTNTGDYQVLLRWCPSNVIEDEWVNEKDAVKHKTISIPSLPPSGTATLYEIEEWGIKAPVTYRMAGRKNIGIRASVTVVTAIEYKKLEVVEEEEEEDDDDEGEEDEEEEAEEEEEEDEEEKEEDEEEEEEEENEEEPSPPTLMEVDDDLNSETPEVVEQSQTSPSPSLSPPVLPPPSPPPPPKKVSNRNRRKTKRKKKDDSDVDCYADQKTLPAVSVPSADIMKDACLTTEKTVSLRPKEEGLSVTALPEEMSVVPVYPTAEEPVPVQTSGILVDNAKFMSSVKAEMVVSSPYKLVTSQYIEQPIVQAVMPVQMPVTYQIPVVKFAQSCGMIFPQMNNYFIPSSTAVFPASTIPAFRNGFQISTTGTIQIQTSSTTLQQTASSFMQSTNTSGFQIVQQTPAPNFQQSLFASYQNSQIASMNIRSPALRFLNYQPQPLIINQPKPIGNVSMTLANVSSIANPAPSTLAVTAMPLDSSEAGNSVMAAGEFVNPTVATMTMAAPLQPPPQPSPPPLPPLPAAPQATSSPATTTTPTKKVVKGNLKILPRPNILRKNGIPEGTKNKKQCLQPCGPSVGKTT